MLGTVALAPSVALMLSAAPTASTAGERIARQFIEQLPAGHFAAAGKAFDGQMKTSLAPDKLAPLWSGILARHGAFQGIEHVTAEPEGYGIAELVTCRFAKSPVTFEVYLDGSNHIAGFLLTPATLIAGRFINALGKSDVAAAEAMFDAKMQKELPAPKLAALWNDLVSQSGAFQQVERAKVGPARDDWAATVDVQFAAASVQLRVVVDGEDRIVGFVRE